MIHFVVTVGLIMAVGASPQLVIGNGVVAAVLARYVNHVEAAQCLLDHEEPVES